MGCDYCRNKKRNKPLVQEEDGYGSGVEAKIIKNDGIALLCIDAWYDGWEDRNGAFHAVGINPGFASIAFCPACGKRLNTPEVWQEQ